MIPQDFSPINANAATISLLVGFGLASPAVSSSDSIVGWSRPVWVGFWFGLVWSVLPHLLDFSSFLEESGMWSL